ncbi:hypothetical protein B0H19DRAFT_1254138 [Mycena capillaripes]|nr:hypothetical protein B0H19DRAFT_1254138 [Mycena capillaripes]
MQLTFPLRGRKPPSPTAKIKPTSLLSRSSALPDLLSTSLLALKQSADAFPPLKSAVGGVLALWDIAERAKHSKSAAHDIALRTITILHVIADAVPDPSIIPLPMQLSIRRFTVLLNKIKAPMDAISLLGGVSRIIHLNRNERTLRSIRDELDEAYRDLLTASVLRVEAQHAGISARQAELAAQQTQYDVQQKRFEVQQTELLAQQTQLRAQQADLAAQQTQLADQHAHTDVSVGKAASVTDAIALDLSRIVRKCEKGGAQTPLRCASFGYDGAWVCVEDDAEARSLGLSAKIKAALDKKAVRNVQLSAHLPLAYFIE